MKCFATITAVAAVAFGAAPASAQSVVLAEGDSGRPLVVNGGSELPRASRAIEATPEEIIREFVAICTPSPTAFEGSETTSIFELEPDPQTFAETRRHDETIIRQWSGQFGWLTVFEGSRDALRGETISIPNRGARTGGQYGPFRADLPQCNLVLLLPDYQMVRDIASALETEFGEARRMTVRDSWADGIWEGIGTNQNLSIAFNVPTSRSGLYPIHLTAFIDE